MARHMTVWNVIFYMSRWFGSKLAIHKDKRELLYANRG